MRQRRMLSSLMLLLCCASWGCGLSLGPQVKTEIVIVEPGKPVEILQPTGKLRCRQLEDASIVYQDAGGWVAMPASHWEVIEKILESKNAAPGK